MGTIIIYSSIIITIIILIYAYYRKRGVCSSNSDCPNGQCINGTCMAAPPATCSPACTPPQQCIAGVCTGNCQTDTNCSWYQKCVSNNCVSSSIPCIRNENCNINQICSNKSCQNTAGCYSWMPIADPTNLPSDAITKCAGSGPCNFAAIGVSLGGILPGYIDTSGNFYYNGTIVKNVKLYYLTSTCTSPPISTSVSTNAVSYQTQQVCWDYGTNNQFVLPNGGSCPAGYKLIANQLT